MIQKISCLFVFFVALFALSCSSPTAFDMCIEESECKDGPEKLVCDEVADLIELTGCDDEPLASCLDGLDDICAMEQTDCSSEKEKFNACGRAYCEKNEAECLKAIQ